jgi:hypothetical protein
MLIYNVTARAARPGTLPLDLLHPFTSGVFAFCGNRTMYPGVQGHVQSIPTTNGGNGFNMYLNPGYLLMKGGEDRELTVPGPTNMVGLGLLHGIHSQSN